MGFTALDFEKARVKHILFKTKLRSVLFGAEMDEKPILSEHECSLGKWIYTRALSAYGHMPEMRDLEKVHANIHSKARHLIDLYKQGHVHAAREGLAEIEEIADRLLDLLSATREIVLRQNPPDTNSVSMEQDLAELQEAIYELDANMKLQAAELTAVKKAAAANEKSFENTVMQAPVGIVVLDGEQLIVETVNDTYLAIVDKSKETLLGRPLYSSLPLVEPAISPIIKNIFATGLPYYGNEFEVLLNRFGAIEKTYFNFVYQPMRDLDGKVTKIMVVATEVTGQVLAKQALQDSEARFRSLFNQSPFAMTIFNGPEHIIHMPNQTLLKNIWRKDLDEVEGKILVEVFPELKDQPYLRILKNVLDTGTRYVEKESVAYVNGNDGMRKFYLDYEYAPLFDARQQVSGVIATVYDITDVVTYRQQIQDTEKRFRLLADSMPQLIWTADVHGNLNYYSQSVFEYSGLTPAEMAEKGWLGIVHPDERDENIKAWTRAVTQGTEFTFEHRFRRSDGQYRWKLSRAIPQKDQQGNIQSWVGTSTDIHERKLFTDELEQRVEQRTQELKQSNEDLLRSNSELFQFAYVASHDLQEPLRKIQTFISRLVETEKSKLSEKGQLYFDRMHESAKKMQQLIIDLLSYSRVNTSEKHMIRLTDLNLLVNLVKEQFKEEIDQKSARILIDDLPSVQIIPFQFEQLFINLISNSLKFTRPDIPPYIHISAAIMPGYSIGSPQADPGKTYHIISVSDNGIGFDNQFADRIFQVFQRLHTKDAFQGTGIGLSICKKILDNHRGFINAKGDPGKGSVFSIFLPR